MTGFVSFERTDAQAMIALRVAMVGQQVDVWDYSVPGHGIKLGAGLERRLSEEIEKASFFVALLSRASLNSEICRFEVAQALARSDLPKLTILLDPEVGLDWPAPFHALRRLIFFDATRDWNPPHFVQELCRALGIPYVSPFAADPEMPFFKRLAEETQALVHPDKLRQVHARAVLDEWRLRFERAYAKAESSAQFRECLDILAVLVGNLRHDFPDHRPYYPLLMRASCEMLAGDLRAGRATLALIEDHPLRDSHFDTVWIYLANREGRFGDAWRRAFRALSKDPTESRFYYAAVDNLLADCEDPTNVQLAVALADSVSNLEREKERAWAQSRLLLARLKAASGDAEAAKKLFESALAHLPEPEAALPYIAFLVEAGMVSEAYAWFAARSESAVDSPDLCYLYSHVADRAADPCTAERVHWTFLENFPGHPYERIVRRNLAVILCRRQARAEASDVVQPLLNRQAFPLASEDDVLCAAAALCLCGQESGGVALLRSWGISESCLSWTAGGA